MRYSNPILPQQCPHYASSCNLPCGPCAEVAALDREIEEAQRRLAALANRRIALSLKVNESHDQLFARFPPEIVAEIFGHYIRVLSRFPDDLPQACTGKELTHFSPLTLAAVCSSWRELVFSSPTLWSSICIDLLGKPRQQDLVDKTKNWLDRAGSLPLSVEFAYGMTTPSVISPARKRQCDFESVINLAKRYANRWTELTLHTVDLSFYERICNDVDWSAASSLRTLKFYSRDILGRCPIPYSIFRLHNTPALTHLELHGTPLSFFDIQWDTLTHLKATFMYLPDVYEALRRAPQLTHLQIACTVAVHEPGATPFSVPATPLTHAALAHIDMVFPFPTRRALVPEHYALAPFDRLALPALASLTYDWRIYPSWVLGSEIIASMGPTLTRLAIKNFRPAGAPQPGARDLDAPPVDMLAQLPALTHLSLAAATRADAPLDGLTSAELAFWAALQPTADADPFLPNLQDLELFYPIRSGFPWAALCAVVEARRPRRVCLGFHAEYAHAIQGELDADAQTRGRLRALRDAGVRLGVYACGSDPTLQELVGDGIVSGMPLKI